MQGGKSGYKRKSLPISGERSAIRPQRSNLKLNR